ncbi:MAG: hypothetical protein QG652_1100 [Pseudomonadota bacterium]|nr:hypothetical protein [Pseudomonadota bacterium]
MNLIRISMLAATVVMTGCAHVQFDNYMDEKQPMTFTYEYSVTGSKLDLWRKGRDFFNSTYVDHRTVIKTTDENAATLTGRGLADWTLGAGSRYQSTCSTAYQIQFAAANNKARVIFEITKGNAPESRCQGWPVPSQNGYIEIRKQFHDLHVALGTALRQEAFSTFQAQ